MARREEPKKIGRVEVSKDTKEFDPIWKAEIWPCVKGQAIGRIVLHQDPAHWRMDREQWIKEVSDFLDLSVEDYTIKDGVDNVIQVRTFLANELGEYIMEVHGE